MIDTQRIFREVVKNLRSREMPFKVEFDNNPEGKQLYTSTIALRPNLTYEDLAEELVTQFKKLVSKNFPNYMEVPTFVVTDWYQGEVEIYDNKAVVLFLYGELKVEGYSALFKKNHIAEGSIVRV